MASFFIVAFPWRFRLEDCDGNKLVLLGPFSPQRFLAGSAD
jgi:hypothetical protein